MHKIGPGDSSQPSKPMDTLSMCSFVGQHGRRVAALIDIEAEASSEEEEESSDEADEDTDAPEADAMFMNDASPASARSQCERR